MAEIWLWCALAVLVDGAAGLAGGLLPERWLIRYRRPLLGFATATLLVAGLFDILPEAIERTGYTALGWVAGAMLVLAAIARLSRRAHHHRERPVVPVALLGSDALHNLGDGIAIAGAFLVGPGAGVATTAAVLLHELPEEVADYALLRTCGMRRGPALFWLATVQLSAGIGVAATLLASQLLASVDGILMAIACGMFLYIALFDLVPALLRRSH